MRQFALLVVPCALTLCAACAPAQPEAGVDGYGVVAASPLPIDVPSTRFDPTSDIADLDGSTVVSQTDGEIIFTSAGSDEAVDVAIDSRSRLRVVSADGTRAALLEAADGVSRITVVDLKRAAPRVFELAGLVEPEAFSTDGRLLYVVDHQASEQPGSYRVRPFNLETGELEDILGPTKLPFDEAMNGTGRRQIWSPDGTRLYTLYIRQALHQHSELTNGFVHVLDLDDEWAYCLDLPPAFGAGDLDSTALAVAPDGNSIAVADLHAGQLAFASTTDLEVTRTVELPILSPSGPLEIGLTSEHVAIGWESEVHWFDAETLRPINETVNLSAALIGFTPTGRNHVLAWTDSTVTGPLSLRSPS